MRKTQGNERALLAKGPNFASEFTVKDSEKCFARLRLKAHFTEAADQESEVYVEKLSTRDGFER